MDDNATVLLDIDFKDLLGSLQRLTKAYADNAAELKELKKQGKETSAEYVNLQQTNKVLAQEIRGVEKAMQNEIKQQNANKGSIVAMRAELANLNKQYDSMSGMERMSEQGTELQQKIKALSAEIQGLEENTGRWQRNVGNYRSALQGMKDATEAAGLSSQGLDRIMKGLSANPRMTVVTVLVTILVKLRDRLKDNEKVTASLGDAMNAMKPVLDWFSKAISKLADIFSNVLDWAIEKTIDALGWLGRQLQKVGQLFGKDWGGGLVDFSARMREARQETEETTETIDEQTTAIENNVKAMREQVELIKALTRDALLSKMAKDNKDLADSISAVAERVGLFNEELDKIDPDRFKDFSEVASDTMEDSTTKWDLFTESLKNNAKTITDTAASMGSAFGSLSSIYETMSKDESKSEEERAKAAMNAKRWAALQIAANSGTAIAKGVSQAVEEPFPANIAAIASTLAAVLAAIAQAKALAAEGHEHGGVLGNRFIGATAGPDTATFRGRPGELILNAQQQRTLYDIANGSGQTSLAASLAAALRNMPPPVMVYSEYNDFKARVATFDETSKLK